MNPTAPGPTRQPTHAVEVRVEDLHKSFEGKPVLCGLNLEVKPGEICVVMGGSGSGKTVLLRHIIGLEQPDRGRIWVGGRDVSDPAQRRELNMAMVFQSAALFNSMTVEENVGLWLRENRPELSDAEVRKMVTNALQMMGLDSINRQIPSELSGGMRKRVAIARALVMQPSLLLYDEPTAELDPLRAEHIGHIIRTLKERRDVTSIVVSHDRDLAFAVGDRVALLHEGKILEHGTPAQLQTSQNPVVKEFLTAGHHPLAATEKPK